MQYTVGDLVATSDNTTINNNDCGLSAIGVKAWPSASITLHTVHAVLHPNYVK